MSELIYLDNAATTKVAPEVYEAMNPYFEEYYGNAASVYRFAGESKKAVENARKEVADFLGAKPNEIYFTGGGSESDNWALKGIAFSQRKKGKHIITSAIEHHAILHTCEYLEKLGYEITYVGVDENGIIKLDELEKSIREDTILISVMFANNEIGSIQPIKEIGEIAKKHKVLFHTDAVQAYGHVPIMWMNAILICFLPAVIRSTDQKESVSCTLEMVCRLSPLSMVVHRSVESVPVHTIHRVS